MNKSTGFNQPRFTQAEIDFLSEMIRELERLYDLRNVEYGLASDAISLAKARVLPRLGRVIENYGTGGRYAAAVHRTTLIDAIRSGNAQRGAGFGKSREVTSLDESVERLAPEVRSVADDFETSQLMQAMLGRMTADEKRDFLRVHIEGFNFSEIAELNHEAHTTSMRRVKRADEKARLAAIEFLGFDPTTDHSA
jgi:hypothetical protein